MEKFWDSLEKFLCTPCFNSWLILLSYYLIFDFLVIILEHSMLSYQIQTENVLIYVNRCEILSHNKFYIRFAILACIKIEFPFGEPSGNVMGKLGNL